MRRSQPVAVRLASVGRAIRHRGLDAADTHAATRAVLDWYAATVAGCDMEPARLLTLAVAGEAGRARLIGSERRVPMRTAALVNGTASHTAELDDIYRDGIYHPGSPTVAAALALAEHLGSSGRDLLRAVAVGYEVGDRVARAVNPAHYRYWHTTGTVGTLGAAAAAADLLDLDETRFAHAVATATTMAAGLQQSFRSEAMSKPLHAGHAAEAGLLAALAAQRGFTGALDVFEGEAGFGAATAGQPDWTSIGGLDEPLLIRQATVKNHSCCGHAFAAVDAALELRSQGLSASDIASVEVYTYTTATRVAGKVHPRSPFEARFSTTYCVAAALRFGAVRLRAFLPEQLADPGVRELEPRITVLADAEMERAFPHQRQASLTVHAKDGRILTAHRRTRKGDPDDPLTDTELGEKLTEVSEPRLGAHRAARLADALWHVADCDDVGRLAADVFGPEFGSRLGPESGR